MSMGVCPLVIGALDTPLAESMIYPDMTWLVLLGRDQSRSDGVFPMQIRARVIAARARFNHPTLDRLEYVERLFLRRHNKQNVGTTL